LQEGEVCWMSGVIRNTPLRWLEEGIVSHVEWRDWLDWRLFGPARLETIAARTGYVTVMTSGD